MKKFKLQSSISGTNMVLFDANQKIKKYKDEGEILKEWIPLRLKLYEKRK